VTFPHDAGRYERFFGGLWSILWHAKVKTKSAVEIGKAAGRAGKSLL